MQGYYDAMKQLGRFDGLYYTFTRVNDLRAATLAAASCERGRGLDAEAVRRATLRADQMVAPDERAGGGLREEKLLPAGASARSELAAALLGFPESAPSTRPARWPRNCARRCLPKTRLRRRAPGSRKPSPEWGRAAPFCRFTRAPDGSAEDCPGVDRAPLRRTPRVAAALGIACAAEL